MKKTLLISVLLGLATSLHAQVINWDNTRISAAAPLCSQGALTATVTAAASHLNDVCLLRSAAGVYKVTANDLATRAAFDAKVALTTTTSGTPNATVGVYQGTTSVGITDTAFHALIAAASDVTLPASSSAVAGRKIRIHASGVYTNAAASLLNVEAMLCTVSGCASGTVVAPAGCTVVTTNQANNLTNGQFKIDCDLTTSSTVGASGTYMAKSTVCANLGAATSAVTSCFQDTAVAVSAAVDQTVAEFVNIGFKFTSSNAGNAAVLHDLSVELINVN